ncbi:MAG: hypothetical protein ACI9W4_000450 [Rhodothermales bacterium]
MTVDRQKRNGLVTAGAVLLVVLLVLFVPIKFQSQDRIPARLFAAQVWTLEHTGGGELVSHVEDREAGVSSLYSVQSIERGDVAAFQLEPGVRLGAVLAAGETIGVLQSTDSDRDFAELTSNVQVSASEIATYTEGAKAALVEAEKKRLEQVQAQLALQERIVSRLRLLRDQGVVSVDEVERAETAEVELRGRIAVFQAELEVLQTGSRESERRLAATRLQATRQRLEALADQRAAFATHTPIGGTVTRSERDSVLVTIKDFSRWVAAFPATMEQAARLQPGTVLDILVSGERAQAVVTHVDRTAGSLAGTNVVLVTCHLSGVPDDTPDRMQAVALLDGPETTLRGKLDEALGTLFTWKTWWSLAPRA